MMYPKTEYVRSQKLLRAVANMECMHCGNPNNVQASHSNWSEHGKGRSIKASDIYIAALCLLCHFQIDQGRDMSKEERKEMWMNAYKKTVQTLIANQQWPSGVPIPDVLNS